MSKRCTKCLEPDKEFRKDSRYDNRLSSWCVECQDKANSQKLKKEKEKEKTAHWAVLSQRVMGKG